MTRFSDDPEITVRLGRHLREGREPSYDEAELAVHVAAGVSRYLSKKAEHRRLGPEAER